MVAKVTIHPIHLLQMALLKQVLSLLRFKGKIFILGRKHIGKQRKQVCKRLLGRTELLNKKSKFVLKNTGLTIP